MGEMVDRTASIKLTKNSELLRCGGLSLGAHRDPTGPRNGADQRAFARSPHLYEAMCRSSEIIIFIISKGLGSTVMG